MSEHYGHIGRHRALSASNQLLAGTSPPYQRQDPSAQIAIWINLSYQTTKVCIAIQRTMPKPPPTRSLRGMSNSIPIDSSQGWQSELPTQYWHRVRTGSSCRVLSAARHTILN